MSMLTASEISMRHERALSKISAYAASWQHCWEGLFAAVVAAPWKQFITVWIDIAQSYGDWPAATSRSELAHNWPTTMQRNNETQENTQLDSRRRNTDNVEWK